MTGLFQKVVSCNYGRKYQINFMALGSISDLLIFRVIKLPTNEWVSWQNWTVFRHCSLTLTICSTYVLLFESFSLQCCCLIYIGVCSYIHQEKGQNFYMSFKCDKWQNLKCLFGRVWSRPHELLQNMSFCNLRSLLVPFFTDAHGKYLK